MKKYIYLIIAIISYLAAFKFGWFFEGQEAVSSAKQLLTGDGYLEGRATSQFWGFLHNLLKVSFYVFSTAFIITFLSKKHENK
jgi:hypothetical protein